MIENDITPKKEIGSPMSPANTNAAQIAPLRVTRHGSLTGSIAGAGKKIFESLGLRGPAQAPISEAANENGGAPSTTAGPSTSPKKRPSIFSFKTYSAKDKDKQEDRVPRTNQTSDRVLASPIPETDPAQEAPLQGHDILSPNQAEALNANIPSTSQE